MKNLISIIQSNKTIREYSPYTFTLTESIYDVTEVSYREDGELNVEEYYGKLVSKKEYTAKDASIYSNCKKIILEDKEVK